MQKQGIVIVGLGPAGANYLTREAWDHLLSCEEIYLRTAFHPVCSELPENLSRQSFDHLYESHDDLEGVLDAIVTELVALAGRPQGVTYGVPGSPFIGEETVSQVIKMLAGTDIPVRIIDGLSYLEPVSSALGLDLLPPQTTILDGLYVGSLLTPPFPPSTPAIISQLGGQFEASELKLTLMHNYPDEFEVKLLHNLGTSEEIIETLPLYAIDQSVHLGMMSTLYLPRARNPPRLKTCKRSSPVCARQVAARGTVSKLILACASICLKKPMKRWKRLMMRTWTVCVKNWAICCCKLSCMPKSPPKRVTLT